MDGCLFISHPLCMSMETLLKRNGVGMWILCHILTWQKSLSLLATKHSSAYGTGTPKKALCRGLKPLNGESDILQLTEDVAGFVVDSDSVCEREEWSILKKEILISILDID